MSAFYRVTVDYVVVGGARVSWDMDRHFTDPGPYVFQLQVGHANVPDTDNWTDVGAPVTDTYFAIDTERRLAGKTADIHYRVKLTTSVDTYYSPVAAAEGLLIQRDWLNYREIVRKEQLRHRVHTSISGFLLKARRYGPRCSICTDQFTEEISRTNCTECFGTGFTLGYFDPLPAVYADVSLPEARDQRDASSGTVQKSVITARFIGDPQLYTYDAWCNGRSDERYYIISVKELAHVRGVAVIFEAELRHAPFSDVVYTVPLDYYAGYTTKQKPAKLQWQQTNNQPGLNYLEAAFAELRERRSRSGRR